MKKIQNTIIIALTVCLILFYVQTILAKNNNDAIANKFRKLTKSTNWHLISKIKMKFRTYHPQGMVIIGDYVYFSTVDKIEPTRKYRKPINGFDRSPGKGIGYLIKTDMHGKLIQKIRLGYGIIYHPGGIDFGKKYIWVPVAEYRPNSLSIIYRINPKTMQTTQMFKVSDHIGAVTYDPNTNTLYGANWGSRKIYRWQLSIRLKPVTKDLIARNLYILNPDNYIDYQDCHFEKNHYMLCGGLNKYQLPSGKSYAFGGLDLIDLRNLQIIWQIPVPLWVSRDLVMTNNPFFVQNLKHLLRFYFMPEDNASTIYIYNVGRGRISYQVPHK